MESQGLISGVLAGTTTAAVCAPVDRALFLAHVHNRPFLRWINFDNPFTGVSNILAQRVLSSGMIFPLEDVVSRSLPEMNKGTRNIVSGTVSASIIAILTNPLATITAQKWKTTGNPSNLQIAAEMYSKQGLRSFNRAIGSTLARDMIWGGTFNFLRHGIPVFYMTVMHPTGTEQPQYQPGVVSFASNIVAAGIAAAVSSPLNYVRNLQFGASAGERHASAGDLVVQLFRDARAHHEQTGGSRAQFLAKRCTIGWGTLRVSFGLALSSQVYEASMLHISSIHPVILF